MTKLIIKTGTEDDFFKRGRQVAKAADRGERLSDERIVSFEDPADMMKLITTARLALFRAVKAHPGSITDISERLHRDRSAVKRDIDELVRAGLVTVADKVLPGHGRMKEVRATAKCFSLRAVVA
ncbi:MAG: helix-turn-helix domain-containing protein [Burkholderiales bacterium]